MTLPDSLTDPWAAELGSPTVRPSGLEGFFFPAAAGIAGALGPALHVVNNGTGGQVGAGVVLFGAVALAISLQNIARFPSASRIIIAAGVIGAVWIPATWFVGRAPWIITTAGVVIATIGLGGWARVGGTPDRVPPFAAGLVALTYAQVLWVSDNRSGVVAFLTISAVLVVLEARGTATLRAISRTFSRVVSQVAVGFGLLVVLIVSMPLLFLPGAVVSASRRLGRRHGASEGVRSSWIVRPATPDIDIRDGQRPFATTALRTRRRRNTLGFFALASAALLLALTLLPASQGIELQSSDPTAETDVADMAAALASIETAPFSNRAAFDGVAFADALQDEIAGIELVDGGPAGYSVKDFVGTYVNVRNGQRVSLASQCSCPRLDVWLVGGSAVFGLGQRDEHTIASELVRLADADGIGIDVHNLGVPGWTLWQEFQDVSARLEESAERPDLIVVYDGYNDTVANVVETAVHGPTPRLPTLLNSDDVLEFLASGVAIDAVYGGAGPLAELAAERYERSRRQLVDLVRSRSIATEFFFQADALTSSLQSSDSDRLYASMPRLAKLQKMNAVLEGTASALAPDVTNLRHLFDDATKPVFYDTVHTNEKGSRRVAEAIYAEIAPALQRAS